MYKIKKIIQIGASRAQVFKALTSSDEIPKYYPLKKVISTWEVDSEVLYKGEIDASPFTDHGVIENITPSSFYSYRYWSDNHGTKRTPENHIMVSYSLTETPKGTELTLIQSNISSKELYNLMETQVWDFLLGSLKEYVESHV